MPGHHGFEDRARHQTRNASATTVGAAHEYVGTWVPGPMSFDRALRVKVLDEGDLINEGLAAMLRVHPDRVTAVAADTEADVALYDAHDEFVNGGLLPCPWARAHAHRIAAFSWVTSPALGERALRLGYDGYLPKSMTADELVPVLEKIDAGETVVAIGNEAPPCAPWEWAGQADGLARRQAEIVSCIARGLSNHEIAKELFLSENTIKSYIRSAYRTMNVTTRAQAVLWAIDHGLRRAS